MLQLTARNLGKSVPGKSAGKVYILWKKRSSSFTKYNIYFSRLICNMFLVMLHWFPTFSWISCINWSINHMWVMRRASRGSLPWYYSFSIFHISVNIVHIHLSQDYKGSNSLPPSIQSCLPKLYWINKMIKCLFISGNRLGEHGVRFPQQISGFDRGYRGRFTRYVG